MPDFAATLALPLPPSKRAAAGVNVVAMLMAPPMRLPNSKAPTMYACAVVERVALCGKKTTLTYVVEPGRVEMFKIFNGPANLQPGMYTWVDCVHETYTPLGGQERISVLARAVLPCDETYADVAARLPRTLDVGEFRTGPVYDVQVPLNSVVALRLEHDPKAQVKLDEADDACFGVLDLPDEMDETSLVHEGQPAVSNAGAPLRVRVYHKIKGALLVQLNNVSCDAACFKLTPAAWTALAPVLLKGASGMMVGHVDRAATAQLVLPKDFHASAVLRGSVFWDVATMVQRAGVEISAEATGQFPPPIPIDGRGGGKTRYFAVSNLSLEELAKVNVAEGRHVAVYAV